MNSKKITGQQIRMARVALKWRVDDLSKYSELPWARLQKFERTDDFLPNDAKTDKLINLSVFASLGKKSSVLSNFCNLAQGNSEYLERSSTLHFKATLAILIC